MVFGNCISKQHNSQVTLQREKNLQLSVEAAVFRVGTDAQFLFINDAACSLTGYSCKQLLSMTMHDIYPNLSAKVWTEYWIKIRQQGSFTFESVCWTQEGSSFLVENIVIYPLPYLEYVGKEYGCIFAHNISKSKQLEVNLKRSIEELESRVKQLTAELKEAKEQSCREIVEARQILEQKAVPNSFWPSISHVNQVFDFIEANYSQHITVYDVAQAVGYSTAYLSNQVKSKTGRTIHNWIVERRMTEARALLLKTDQAVNQIAAAVGYPDPGHFIRQFRQLYSRPPKEWRNIHRSQSGIE
ncbi:helix-turn-helix domain-containing protein [Nostoc sp. PA-18-2419]|uniref:helix-turn-helix domain-containing protein n=1 Tax=Nostoc sp. PA-18-2419 TaxID=2575443 RepID=UPI001109BD33|nr:AraC family transcriptional regulator [Nostoc sp. PA-18-2419]